MGTLNLLKGSFSGKVGQLVGSKWKNKSTVRSFTPPAYTNTPAQQIIRTGFGEQAKFLALFTDQLKSLSPLNTKAMSVRNAIIQLNKNQIADGTFDPTELIISRGGLPLPTNIECEIDSAYTKVQFSWVPAVGATISNKAKVVCVAASYDDHIGLVGEAKNVEGALDLTGTIPEGSIIHCYVYLLDYRGSTKVGSISHYIAAAEPTVRANG